MQQHHIAILAGLVLGAYAGHRYAGRLAGYPPYSSILSVMRGTLRPQTVIVNPSLSDRINLAAGAVKSIVGEFNDGLDTLHSLFGSGSSTPSTSDSIMVIDDAANSGDA